MAKILYAASTASHIKSFHIPYIEALRDEGHTVLTLANGVGVDFDVPFTKRFFSVKNKKARKMVKSIVDGGGFDAIVLNTALAAFHIRLALPKRHRPRVVNIVHGYLFHKDDRGLKARLLRFCERLVAKKTDKILVMNAEDKAIADGDGLAKAPASEIPGMGASVRPPITERAALSSELSLDGRFVIAFVGELSDRKNQRFLISALPRIKSFIPTLTLCLVGDGAARDELTALADRLSVSDSVVFAGYRQDACDVIRLCDLYISASNIEGMPFNIIEALGLSKPIIASDIKGHRDLLSGGAGLLYTPESIEELVLLVRSVYENKITIDISTMRSVYSEYSFENVFPRTFLMIKEAIFG